MPVTVHPGQSAMARRPRAMARPPRAGPAPRSPLRWPSGGGPSSAASFTRTAALVAATLGGSSYCYLVDRDNKY